MPIHRVRTVALLLLAIHFSEPAIADESGLQYRLSFRDRSSHFLYVELRVPDSSGNEIELVMPIWTPGSYLMREYARHVDQLSATGPAGESLSIERRGRDRWAVDTKERSGPIRISYRIYCREMSVRTNWVDSEMAILNGAATYLSVPQFRNRPHYVEADLPDGWQVATALEERAEKYVATDFHELVDSPVIASKLKTTEFDVGGVPHRLVSFGDAELWDSAQATNDVRKIVQAHQKFWGHTPYPHYTFLNGVVESRGGLEHDNCTLVMTNRFAFRDPEQYENWQSLISHEFFHTWNVRRLRPVELRNYDLQKENYTRSLWVAEGITSYYEDLLLLRADVIDQDAWLKRLSKDIKKLQAGPGRLNQSLSESSYDTWIKFYRPHENSRNIHVSYYTKGAVVAFLLDAKIREATMNRKSLDDVMRMLYRDFEQTGYSVEDFRKTCSAIADTDLSDWLDEHVNKAKEIEYQPAMDWYGLTFETPTDPETTDSEKPEEHKIWLGVEFKEDVANPILSLIRSDGPAAAAGLNVGDELIALNDIRCTKAGIEKQLQQHPVGDNLELLVARRGRLIRFTLNAETEPEQLWELSLKAERTEQQKANLDSLFNP